MHPNLAFIYSWNLSGIYASTPAAAVFDYYYSDNYKNIASNY